MSTELKLRRGTTVQHSTFTGAEGEVTVDTTKDTLVVHDGATVGGHAVATEAGVSTALASKADVNVATGAVFLGSGTTAQRPTLLSTVRAMWYNTDLSAFEVWNGTNWGTTLPSMLVGNTNSPLLDMPLKNSLVMKAGVGSATFTRASTATYIDRYGMLKSAAVDEPRFEKEGYLNEGTSTNLLTYSEQFDNASWGKIGVTIVANTTETLDPYGTNLAEKLTNSGGVTSLIYENITVPASTTNIYAASIFCKAGTLPRITINAYYAGEVEYNIHFEFSTKTFSGVPAGGSANYLELSNGWYRVTFIMPTSTTSATTLLYRIWGDRLTTTVGGYNYIFGAQLEALPFATSYIPTVASMVSRSADVLNVSYSGNIPTTTDDYTIAIDVSTLGFVSTTYQTFIRPNDDGRMVRGNSVELDFRGSGVNRTTAPIIKDTKYRLMYSVGALLSAYVNGILVGSVAKTAGSGTLSLINIGHYSSTANVYGHISNVRIYDKALTVQEVALA